MATIDERFHVLADYNSRRAPQALWECPSCGDQNIKPTHRREHAERCRELSDDVNDSLEWGDR